MLITGVVLSGCLSVSPVHAAELKCTGCHAALLRGTVVHNPVAEGECLFCHEQDASKVHPLQKKSMRLQAAGSELCYRCHDSKSNMKHPHPPVAAGECTSCHDPHHSANKSLLKKAGGDLCATCHGSMVTKKYGHPPVAAGECTECHDPHQSDQPKMLKAPVPALCYSCHGKLFTKKYLHPPVAAGDCLACHDPHEADNPKMLRETGIKLCLECHEDTFTNNKVGHPPVMAGECFDCHDPHQSDNPKLLLKPGSELCFTCHDSSMAAGKDVHPPVRSGNCIACHNPHGSDNARMLVKPFPESFYLPYAPDQYALCFQCHNRDIAQDARTDTLTNFRNGDRNLHYVHVNRPEKGRSCKVCHDPHASSMDRLIRSQVPGFGNWDIPINFTKTETGGTCVVGCHKPRTYDRLHAVRYR